MLPPRMVGHLGCIIIVIFILIMMQDTIVTRRIVCIVYRDFAFVVTPWISFICSSFSIERAPSIPRARISYSSLRCHRHWITRYVWIRYNRRGTMNWSIILRHDWRRSIYVMVIATVRLVVSSNNSTTTTANWYRKTTTCDRMRISSFCYNESRRKNTIDGKSQGIV